MLTSAVPGCERASTNSTLWEFLKSSLEAINSVNVRVEKHFATLFVQLPKTSLIQTVSKVSDDWPV